MVSFVQSRNMRSFFLGAILVILAIGQVEMHSYHLGGCPTIEPEPNFEMNKWTLNVWGGIINDYVIGPYCFKGRLTGQIFLQFLQDDLPLLLEQVPEEIRGEMWFLSDGVPAHFHRNMLGIWYVIEKTSTASSCIVYNISRTEEPGEYRIEEISQHFLLALTPLKHGYHYAGTLMVPDAAVPAKMTVKFPLSVAGSSSFTVFATDYETYAGIFTCQKLTFAHRQSATILSRRRTLDKMYIDKLRNKLANAQIDPFELSIIKQKECPKDLQEGYNININDETISAKAAADVIRKAGEKIGDGVEYISGKTKDAVEKIYDRDVETITSKATLRKMEADAEWLP